MEYIVALLIVVCILLAVFLVFSIVERAREKKWEKLQHELLNERIETIANKRFENEIDLNDLRTDLGYEWEPGSRKGKWVKK